MQIRPAEERDIPELLALINTSDASVLLHRLKQMSRDEGAYLVAEDRGQICGHVFLDYYGRTKYPQFPDIVDLKVSEDKQGEGIGTELIHICEEIARSKGFNLIGLSLNPSLNPRARRLYERLGYFPSGNSPRLDGVYSGKEDWLIDLTKRLEVKL